MGRRKGTVPPWAVGLLCAVLLLAFVRPLLAQRVREELQTAWEKSVISSVARIAKEQHLTAIDLLSTEGRQGRTLVTADNLRLELLTLLVRQDLNPPAVSIPLGTFTGWRFLSGLGPGVPFPVKAWSGVQVGYGTGLTFGEKGAALYQITLRATGSFRVFTPFGWVTGTPTAALRLCETLVLE